jgi:chaperonin cofactor prefoldin
MDWTYVVVCFFIWLAVDNVFGKDKNCDCCEELEDDLDELDVDLHREIEGLQEQINELKEQLKERNEKTYLAD